MDLILEVFTKIGMGFHRLFHPHCSDCAVLDMERRGREEDELHCRSCETLEKILEIEIHEKERLLELLMKKEQPSETHEPSPEPVRPKFVPWNIRRQMLENEAAAKQKVHTSLKMDKLTIEELEDELLRDNSDAIEIG